MVRSTDIMTQEARNSRHDVGMFVCVMELNFHKMYSEWLVRLDQRQQAPGWWFPGYLGVCILSCIPPPEMKVFRVALFGPILLSYLLYTPNYTTGDTGGDFAAGVFMAGLTMKWLDFVLFRVPEKEFWRVEPEENSASDKVSPVPDRGLLEKIRWSISLWCTNRGIGWNWQVKNLQNGVPRGYSRM